MPISRIEYMIRLSNYSWRDIYAKEAFRIFAGILLAGGAGCPVWPTGRGGRNGRDSGSVKVEISVGRMNKIAPNFVLGALVDATGMAGKNFGKIDIYDRFTTVEIPEADKDHVIESMTGTKINGQKIKIKLYEGKDREKDKDSRSGKDYRRLDRKRDYGKRPHHGNSAGRRSSKRYQ